MRTHAKPSRRKLNMSDSKPQLTQDELNLSFFQMVYEIVNACQFPGFMAEKVLQVKFVAADNVQKLEEKMKTPAVKAEEAVAKLELVNP